MREKIRDKTRLEHILEAIDEIVWDTIQKDLPSLKEDISLLLSSKACFG